ncbi:MAG: hypothetical protein QCH35_01660 [Methanomicrobiaceae archaeon]|nr:hypothetical protein [Methanomicrobiaceae archaeon]
MTQKTMIIEQLGEEELLRPSLVNTALAANDRIKYYFTLLQAARSHAENPTSEFSNLKTEREAAGEYNTLLDRVVEGSEKMGSGIFKIPHADEIMSSLRTCLEEMAEPILRDDHEPPGQLLQRLERLTADLPSGEYGTITLEAIQAITAGKRTEGDSIHILVMDMHRGLNAMQAKLSRETINGARTYLLTAEDREMVEAFMEGLNRTSPLKFDHPGLGTTATRSGKRLVIQNDIGMTDAHVLVVTIEGATVSIIYTDIHMQRLQFFQGMFEGWHVRWHDTISKNADARFEQEVYHLSVGTYQALDAGELKQFLDHLGSRIVFMIDWNRARKRLRNFVRNSDAIGILTWAAQTDIGHRAWLQLGGESLIYGALESVTGAAVRPGEPLHQIIGRENAVNYLKWVLDTTKNSLVANHSLLLVRDEIKAELQRYFRSVNEELLSLIEEHTYLAFDVATAVRDSLLSIQRSYDKACIERSARRAKQWETRADDIVNKVRSLSTRMEAPDIFSHLISVTDDVCDYLEEACFYITLIPNGWGPATPIHKNLTNLAEIALLGSQEFIKVIIAAQYIYRGGGRMEMKTFLESVDRVISLEQVADEELRECHKTILRESADHRDLWLYSEIARNIENSTNAQRKSSHLMRDIIMEKIIR